MILGSCRCLLPPLPHPICIQTATMTRRVSGLEEARPSESYLKILCHLWERISLLPSRVPGCLSWLPVHERRRRLLRPLFNCSPPILADWSSTRQRRKKREKSEFSFWHANLNIPSFDRGQAAVAKVEQHDRERPAELIFGKLMPCTFLWNARKRDSNRSRGVGLLAQLDSGGFQRGSTPLNESSALNPLSPSV